MNMQINEKNFSYSDLWTLRIGIEIVQEVFTQQFGARLLSQLKEMQYSMMDEMEARLKDDPEKLELLDELDFRNRDLKEAIFIDFQSRWVNRQNPTSYLQPKRLQTA